MRRYLVVANQTLGGEKLDGLVRDRIQRGDSHFYLVVPMTALRFETAWAGDLDFPMGDLDHRQMEEERETRLAEARDEAQHRLDRMTAMLRAAGGEVDGEVVGTDPVAAVRTVLRDRSFDEIILSTLPAGISRWLKMDLPSRVARMTDVPVVTIEADDSASDSST